MYNEMYALVVLSIYLPARVGMYCVGPGRPINVNAMQGSNAILRYVMTQGLYGYHTGKVIFNRTGQIHTFSIKLKSAVIVLAYCRQNIRTGLKFI